MVLGLLDTAATWVLNDPTESLGFILADAGFVIYILLHNEDMMCGWRIREEIHTLITTFIILLMKMNIGHGVGMSMPQLTCPRLSLMCST
jgi:hypothetical protein